MEPNTILVLMFIFIGIPVAVIYVGVPRWGRRFNRWLVRNTLDKLSEMAEKYKNMKKVSNPTDTFKWWMSLTGVFVLIVLIAGLLSHFQYVENAKYACTWSDDTSECEFDYSYFAPDGMRPLDRLNPSKLGIEMKCRCGDGENHIMIYEKFKRWLK